MVSQQKPRKQAPPPAPTTPPPAAAPAIPGVGAGVAGAATAAALAALFMSTLAGMALIIACRKVLAAIGVSVLILVFLAGYAFSRLPDRQSPFPMGPAEEEQVRLAAAYRAWYIVNAVTRLERAEAKGPAALAKAEALEARYFQLHMRAIRNRIVAAEEVDAAARRWGLLLGWRAVMDSRTTLECRAANGKNFRADREPVIGWPGSVHPHCRCRPIGPFPGARLIPSV